MAEYIEREKVCELCGAKDLDWCSDECLIFMGNVPAADVAPVVHSYWRHGNCASCGLYVGATTSRFFNYCPNCGARMDGE